jgi:dihydroorotate dehydrogenase (NAD+) catalytic subunit
MFRQDLSIASPWMNAAGTLGFLPPSAGVWPVSEPMGAFVTNPISLGPRTPAAERCLLAYPGGVLMHTGLPNPGLSRVLKKYAARWAKSSLPIWVHLIGSRPDEIHEMVRRLEGVEGVMAVEIGLPPDASGDPALEYVEAAFGELPLVVNLPLTAAGEPWLAELPGLGASAVSLCGPRGMLPAESGRLASGRLYGSSLLPMMIAALHALRGLGIPVIAGAGVYSRKDAESLRQAGAWAVQLDTVLWRGWMA